MSSERQRSLEQIPTLIFTFFPNMKIKLSSLTIGLLLSASPWLAPEIASQIRKDSKSEMQEAMMRVYSNILEENPNDYQTLFRRANGYYAANRYADALTDVNVAIAKAPATEKDFLFDAYNLRAGIEERLGRYTDAISDYRKALSLHPRDYATTYQLANLEFEAGEYAEAKRDYQSLQRLNARSQEALFGLARIAVKENDFPLAMNLLKQAVELNPTSAVSYMRQASVFRMMGNNTDAVDNYTIALSLDNDVMPTALREMVELARTDYPGVMNGLQKAIDKNPHSATYYYLRAMIAMAHFHYLPALTDFNQLVALNVPDKAIYIAMAECLYNLGNYPDALEKIDYAINLPGHDYDARVWRSKILNAQGNHTGAIESATIAMEENSDYAPAFEAKGVAQQGNVEYAEANLTLAKAVELDPRRPMYLMRRAYLLAQEMHLTLQAISCYKDVIALEYPATQVVSLKGFALLFSGRADEGDAWIDHITSTQTDSDGEIAYYAACYWAQRGNLAKAFEFVDKSLRAGYGSYHNWTAAIDGGVNVAPLRNDERFKALLNRYSDIFQK